MREWKTVRLDEVADIRISNVDKKSIAGERPIRLCNYMDVYGNDYIDGRCDFMEATAAAAEIERFKLQSGDVLITKDSETPDDIGIPAVMIEDVEGLVAGYHLALIRPRRNRVDPVYLAKQMSAAKAVSHLSCRAAGSTRYGLSISTIASTPIVLPPLDVQGRIAEILSTLDNAITRTEELISKLRSIMSGMAHDLLTRGVNSNGQPRPLKCDAPRLYKTSLFGWIPTDWNTNKCFEICDKITVGIVVRPVQYYVDEGVPALRSANVREDGIFADNFVFISEKSNALLAKSQVRGGDVVSVRTGYPGTSAVIPDYLSGANCIDILISRPSSAVLADYLALWINSSFGKDQVLRKQGGLAQQHFNVSELRELVVAVPSLAEQRRILARIAAVSDRIQAENQEKIKFLQIKKALSGSLLQSSSGPSSGDYP